jgi:hypothetical protein
MTDTATAAAETLVAPVDTSSPPQPAPDASPNAETPGAGESNAQPGSGAGEPAAANPEGQQGEESKEKPKSRFQERINELTLKSRTLERRNAELAAEAAELRKYLQPPPPHASLEEQDEYRVKKAVGEMQIGNLEREAKRTKEAADFAMYERFVAKAEAVADRMPGLVDKFVAVPGVNETIAQFVADSDKGAEVAFHLSQNPREVERIAGLPLAHQGIELARLEGKLSVAPAIRKVSTAPNPPPTVTGNPSPAGRTSAELSVAEMQAMFKKKGLIG